MLRWPPACGALAALSLLVSLSWGGAPAQAGFPGTNGKIFCEGLNDREPGTGDAEIFSVNADGSAYTLVTNNGPRVHPDVGTAFLHDVNPAVSPNGKRVAWSTNRDGGSHIYIKNTDGTGPETRLTFEGVARVHSWSPDSRQIYFNNNLVPGFPGNNEVFRMNADGSNQTNLTNRATSDVAPAVKPDGTTVLFQSNRNPASNDFDIHSMNPDGTGVTNLTNNVAQHELDANWKPDGTEIVFERAALNFSVSNIFKMNADGSQVTQLTFQTAGLNRNPVWSPDGTRIAFDSGRDSAPGLPNNQEVYTMNPDGSDVRRVTTSLGADSNCDWQAIPRAAVLRPPPPAGPAYPGPPVAGRVRPKLLRPRVRAVQRGRRIVVRVRGRMVGNQGRPCGGRLKFGNRVRLKLVATRTGRMRSNCRYRKRYVFPVRRLPARLRPRGRRVVLKVRVRYGGNSKLTGARSPVRRAKVIRR